MTKPSGEIAIRPAFLGHRIYVRVGFAVWATEGYPWVYVFGPRSRAERIATQQYQRMQNSREQFFESLNNSASKASQARTKLSGERRPTPPFNPIRDDDPTDEEVLQFTHAPSAGRDVPEYSHIQWGPSRCCCHRYFDESMTYGDDLPPDQTPTITEEKAGY